MRFLEKKTEEPRTDLTPLVDVVFQLIIYFAVSTTFAFMGAMKVNLPKAGTPTLSASQKKIMLVIDQKENLYWEHQPLGWEELKTRLKQAFQENPDILVVIEADQNVHHGTVVKVLDLAKTIGFTRLAIATAPKEKEAPAKK